MPLVDLPLDQLRGYISGGTPPADLRVFWDATLDEARTFPLNATFEPVENHLSVIDTFDVTFAGCGGILGETADPHPSAGEVAYAGLMTRGAGSREDYYYRRVYVDAFRAVEAAQSHPEVDPSRVVLAGVILARTATAPALYPVAQMDDVCPPSTVFASFNAYGSDSAAQKEIEVYRFNNHGGGQEHHWIRQLQYLRRLLG